MQSPHWERDLCMPRSKAAVFVFCVATINMCEAARQSYCWSIPHHGSYGNDGILTSFVPECGKYDDGSQCGKSGLWCPSHGGPSQPNTDLSRYGNSWRMGNNNNGGICMGESSGYPAQVGMGADSCFCWEGYQGNKATRTCEACPAGKYKDAKQRLDISNNRDGNWQWSDIVEALDADNFGQECLMCPWGKYSTETASEHCTDCAAGKYMNHDIRKDHNGESIRYYTLPGGLPDANACMPCMNTFQDKQRYCPPGSAYRIGEDCPVGHYCPTAASKVLCGNGEYSHGGQSTCTACPENSWHTLVGQSKTACQCNAGFTGPDGGPCVPCLSHSSKKVRGSSPCLCDAGYGYLRDHGYYSWDGTGSVWTINPGQAKCERCPAGQYKRDSGNHACSTCPANAQSSADATDCMCQDGFGSKFLPETPRIPTEDLKCEDCSAIDFKFEKVDASIISDETRRHKCLDCQWGSYETQIQPVSTQHHRSLVFPGNTCECSPGYEADNLNPDSKVCKICDNGFFKSITSDSAVCEPCSDNTTSFNTPGYFYDSLQILQYKTKTDRCVCEAGYRCADSACTSCVFCPAGQWKSDLGNISCRDCGEHTTTDGMQAVTSPEQCDFCAQGKQYDTSHPERCRSCPAGKFGEFHADGHAICSPCPNKFYSNTDGVLECTQCDPGKYSVYNSTACFSQICGVGSVTHDSEKNECVCNENYVNNQHALSQWTEDTRYAREFFTVHQEKNISKFRIHLTQEYATCIDRISARHSKRVFRSNVVQADSITFFAGDTIELRLDDETILQQPEGWVLEIERNLSTSAERYPLDERSAYENFTVPHSFLLETQPSTLQISLLKFSTPVLKILVTYLVRPETFLGCLATPACSSGAILDEAATASACKLCPRGKFADTELEQCRPCGARRTTASVGESSASSCVCDYGMQGENCTACEPGTAKAVLGPAVCSACIPGKYQNAAGQKNCKPCPFGFSSAEHGARACFPCGVDSQNCSAPHVSNVSVTEDAFRYYMRLKSRPECTAPTCSSVPGFFCSAGLCVNITFACVAGHFCPGGNVSAVPCSAPPGTFCAPGLAEEIHSTCPAGFFCPGGSSDKIACDQTTTTVAGSATAAACVCKAGLFYSWAIAGCAPCAEGTYKSAIGNHEQCTQCLSSQTSALASVEQSACVCVPGYSRLGDGSCEMCPENTVAADLNSSVCTAVTCGHNQASPAGSSIKSCHCAAGYTLASDSTCSACDVGFFKATISDDPCQPCPENHTSLAGSTSLQACLCTPGLFKTSESDQRCQSCPQNRTSAVGATSAVGCVCEPGYEPSSDGVACQVCSRGKFKTEMGDEPCLDCPAGFYSETESALLCEPCSPLTSSAPGSATAADCACTRGFFLSDNATFTCAACAVDTFKDALGNTTCQSCNFAGCAEGQVLDGCGDDSPGTCVQCAAGKYSASDFRLCLVCPRGKYSVQGGVSSSCTNCGRGKYSSATGASSSGTCTDCSVGRYSDSFGASSSSACRSCPSGKYSSSTGQSGCSNCPAGKYQSSTGRSSCNTCARGKYQGGWGKSSCINCARGKYSWDTGQTTSSTCTSCPTGKYSTMYAATRSSDCKLCDLGKFQSQSGMSYCSDCAAGKAQSSSGSTSCNICGAGFYSSSTSYCDRCGPGKYSSSHYGNAACTNCPAGKWHNKYQQVGPLNCA